MMRHDDCPLRVMGIQKGFHFAQGFPVKVTRVLGPEFPVVTKGIADAFVVVHSLSSLKGGLGPVVVVQGKVCPQGAAKDVPPLQMEAAVFQDMDVTASRGCLQLFTNSRCTVAVELMVPADVRHGSVSTEFMDPGQGVEFGMNISCKQDQITINRRDVGGAKLTVKVAQETDSHKKKRSGEDATAPPGCTKVLEVESRSQEAALGRRLKNRRQARAKPVQTRRMAASVLKAATACPGRPKSSPVCR